MTQLLAAEVISGLAWSLFGFLGGYLTAWIPTRRIAMDREPIRRGIPRWVGVVLIILAVLTVGEGWYFNQLDAKQTDATAARTACQAEFNQQFVVVLTKRTEWANEDRSELNRLMTRWINSHDRVEPRKALQDYLNAVAINDNHRASNPLPSLDQHPC